MALPLDDSRNTRLNRVVRGYGWGFLALLALMSLVNTEAPVAGLGRLTLFTLVMPPVVVLGLVLMALRQRQGPQEQEAIAATPARGLHRVVHMGHGRIPPTGGTRRWMTNHFGRIPPAAWVCLFSALGLFGLALLSVLWSDSTILVNKAAVRTSVPDDIRVVPLVNGMLSLLGGFCLIAVTPQLWRLRMLWWVSVALVPLSVLGWLRVALTQQELPVRLWTQLGGAAVYPVALMVGLGIAVAAALAHYRTRASGLLVVCHVAMLLLTGSRGALLMLAVFVVLLAVRIGRNRHGAQALRRTLSPVTILLGVLSIGVALAVSPILSRVGDRSAGRLMTWRVGIGALDHDPVRWLLGTGSGTLWPWYAWESGWQAMPYRSRVTGPFGLTLYHAHSLYLEVLAELGLIGCLLLLGVFLPLMLRWLRGGTIPAVVVTCAAGACLVGFNFDLLLLKNFAVSLLWWTAAFSALMGGTGEDAVASGKSPPGASRD